MHGRALVHTFVPSGERTVFEATVALDLTDKCRRKEEKEARERKKPRSGPLDLE